MKNHYNRNMLCAIVALFVIAGVTACVKAPVEPASQPETSMSKSSSSEEQMPDMESSSAPEEPAPISAPKTDTEWALLEAEKVPVFENLYSWNPADYTYHRIAADDYKGREELFQRLQSYQPDATGVKESNPTEKLGFLATMSDGTKHNYYVTPTQLSSKEDGVLSATAKECEELLTLARENNASSGGIPQWLAYMSLNRLTRVEFSGMNTQTLEDLDFDTTERAYMNRMGNYLRGLKVKPNSTKVLKGPINPNVPAGLMTLRLHFDSGVVYDLMLEDTYLGVQASDMDYSLHYTMTSDGVGEQVRNIAEEIHCGLTGQNAPGSGSTDRGNPMTGKPVIYLYPQKPMDVAVNLKFGGELWYTYPTLGSGWNVTAYPDGRLVNKADGTEHFYLFWEGSSDTDWSFDEGFCVAGEDTQRFLLEKLAYLGLTPREYNDFITYWVPKMQDNPYNLITFAGAQYEQLAPLTVSPAPDSMLRVHMVYKALEQPVEIPAQTLSPFTGSGFTVVEWGGSRA